jgi:hypothetical protein
MLEGQAGGSITHTLLPLYFTMTTGLPTAASAGQATGRGGGGLHVGICLPGAALGQFTGIIAAHVPSALFTIFHL